MLRPRMNKKFALVRLSIENIKCRKYNEMGLNQNGEKPYEEAPLIELYLCIDVGLEDSTVKRLFFWSELIRQRKTQGLGKNLDTHNT